MKYAKPGGKTQILRMAQAQGAVTPEQAFEKMPHIKRKTILNYVWELCSEGKMERVGDKWRLKEGFSPPPEPPEIPEILPELSPSEIYPSEIPKPTPISKTSPLEEGRQILDQRGRFIQHMVDIGVTPKEAIPTIADIFFAGDIDDLDQLKEVLTREAAGYVTPRQVRLIMSWWARTRLLPYTDIVPIPEDAKTTPLQGFDIGWKVDKDRQGDWKPFPGGPLSYEKALEFAERRAALAIYNDNDDAAAADDAAPRKKAAATPQEDFMGKMMQVMAERMLKEPEKSGENDELRLLRDKIENLEREKTDDRINKLEDLLTQVLTRDPWEEIQKWQLRFPQPAPAPAPPNPNDSASVNLVRDAADKIDKNVNRVTGLVERHMLKTIDHFQPEETRTENQREQTAEELLDTLKDRDIRKKTFGA